MSKLRRSLISKKGVLADNTKMLEKPCEKSTMGNVDETSLPHGAGGEQGNMLPVQLLFILVASPILVFSAAAQDTSSSLDTTIVYGGEMKDEPSYFGDEIRELSEGDTVLIRQRKEDYLQVSHQGKKGWMSERQVMSPQERREYRKEIRAQRKKTRERRARLQRFRSKGYTIILARQTIGKNSADGISVWSEPDITDR